MANEQNLKKITNRERARELQEKSVEKRKENLEKKKTFRAMLELALEQINSETGKTKREEINDAIIERAKEIINEIGNTSNENIENVPPMEFNQMTLFDFVAEKNTATNSKLIDKISQIKINEITPLEAINVLSELQKMI